MTCNFDTAPKIHAILYRYRPNRTTGRRIITFEPPESFGPEEIEHVAEEIRMPEVMAQLDAEEMVILALAASSAKERFDDDAGIAIALQDLLSSRGGELDVDIALLAITSVGSGRDILETFPGMAGSSAMIEAIIKADSQGRADLSEYTIDVDSLKIGNLEQARRVLPIMERHANDFLPTFIVAAMARGLGWTQWVMLFAVLFNERELAGEKVSLGPNRREKETDNSLKMRCEAWADIVPNLPLRRVAHLILDLDGALLMSGPDMRTVFVERLQDAIGFDRDLRRATVEALLSRSLGQQRDLALFAATRLVEVDDEAFVSELADHSDRRIGYHADLVRHAVFGKVAADDSWPKPGINAVANGLFQIGLNPIPTEHPLTWIGDRLLEQLIEQTISGEERRFAEEYRAYSEEGEEGLLRSFFANLAHRFRDLEQGLEATARAIGADRTTSIELNYRPVDKSEEGKPGVNLHGYADNPAFSADLCLIVDPYLNGRQLGKRATLVQAKRLRLKDTKRPENGLRPSFKLDPRQMKDLIQQTGSSFYLFQCPGLLDRGIPMVPTQLVEDLARHHAPSAAQIPADLVGPASRPFAEWLTYMVLALRTGDPLAELVAKVEGGSGRRLRRLAKFGTVEIALRVDTPKSKDGEGLR